MALKCHKDKALYKPNEQRFGPFGLDLPLRDNVSPIGGGGRAKAQGEHCPVVRTGLLLLAIGHGEVSEEVAVAAGLFTCYLISSFERHISSWPLFLEPVPQSQPASVLSDLCQTLQSTNKATINYSTLWI